MNGGRSTPCAAALGLALLLWSGCTGTQTTNPNLIVLGMASGPNSLDPRIGTDDYSAKTFQLIFDNLLELDEHLRLVPRLAERLDHPTPLTYVATLRRGVLFHDGHELTSDDVVHTFSSFLDPEFPSPRKGGYRELASVEALDRYRVSFTLRELFVSFPSNLVIPIVPSSAGPTFGQQPVGTGPYRFIRSLTDDRIELDAFPEYFGGRPRNDGILLKIVPDDVMRGLELRKGTLDVVVNDLAPDIVRQLQTDARLQTLEAPGMDYQYVGLNVGDPILKDVRVRQALAHAIDRDSIVRHLRRGLAVPAAGMLPPLSWATAGDVSPFPYDPMRARTLLDAAGHPDPDGDGPTPRFRLTYKVSNAEFSRLQSSVIQEQLQRVGVAIDVRTYEFATLYADVLAGNFQLFSLQWTGGSLADPDILRRVFHSSQVPPFGFNRGRFANPQVDQILDNAARTEDQDERGALYAAAQRVIAREVPYVSLWHKVNVAVAQRSITGIRLTPMADFLFLKEVERIGGAGAN